ncbi:MULTISPECIES: RusA family crossover junction endodeoxyribonuclease [unclassified Endozoicomonas]|uniref:RusA family crossover junction endodeoxyribonuclease n=1 Tax=unclassified Endozoicomonas TaxID=2644528 RepID=UPI003BB73869
MGSVEQWIQCLPESLQMAINNTGNAGNVIAFVNSIPKSKGRPRFTRSGRCYTPAATRQAENEIRCLARLQLKKMLAGPVGVLVVAVFPIPSSWSGTKAGQAQAGGIRPAVKPDFDNVAKLYCDALNGILWEDDRQIVDGRCIKVYGQQPGVLVIGWPL